MHVHTCMSAGISMFAVNMFASGSWDGAIILWSTNSLNALKMFQCAEGMPRELTPILPVAAQTTAAASTRNSTEIRHIIAIGEVCTCSPFFLYSSSLVV